MKTSRYNLFVPHENETSIVYNTFRGSISRVDSNLADVLKNGKLEKLNLREHGEIITGLKKQGILVPQETNELEEYSKMHQRWKEGREKVEFNALLTYDCNFECPYCYQGRGEKGQQIHGFRYMDSWTLKATKKFIKNTTRERGAKRLELVLYGGEPFLPKAWPMGKDLTEDLKEWTDFLGISFGLHALSNGSLINQDIVNWLSKYKTRLQIPVDGDEAMHNKYRFYKQDNRGSFNDVAKALEMTKGTDIETHIRISLTDETAPTMENLLDNLKSRGLNHVYPDFCYITAFTDACADFKDHTLSDLRLFKIMPDLWRAAHKRGFPLDIRPKVQPLPCSSIANGSFIIDPFRDVYKCWELVGLKEHAVGKIDIEGELEKTQVYNDVLERNPLNIDQCKEHSYLPACGGGCVCKAQWKYNTYHAPGCGSEKYLLADKIKVYVETLDLSKSPITSVGDSTLQIIEGEQEPSMSHCYVLV